MTISRIVYLCNAAVPSRWRLVRRLPFGEFKRIRSFYQNPRPEGCDMEQLKIWFPHHRLNPKGMVGSYACYLGHMAIIRQAVADRLSNIVVLEDDTMPVDLSWLHKIPEDADAINFLRSSDNPAHPKLVHDPKLDFQLTTIGSSATAAYFLSAAGMQAFLEFFKPQPTYSDMFFWRCQGLADGSLRQYCCNRRAFMSIPGCKTTIGYENLA